MELFNYSYLNFITKHIDKIYIGCLIALGIGLIIGIIVSFLKETVFGKIFSLILTVAIIVGLYFGAGYLKSFNEDVNAEYLRCKALEDAGEFKVVKGRVEDFTPATKSKSFSIEGVEFKIYSTTTRGGPVLYYRYSDAYAYYDTTSHLTHHYPEKCVILGDNQYLEIYYIFEEGENRIMKIIEIEE